MSSPVANPDVLEILENTPFVVAAEDFLSNDTDADGDFSPSSGGATPTI